MLFKYTVHLIFQNFLFFFIIQIETFKFISVNVHIQHTQNMLLLNSNRNLRFFSFRSDIRSTHKVKMYVQKIAIHLTRKRTYFLVPSSVNTQGILLFFPLQGMGRMLVYVCTQHPQPSTPIPPPPPTPGILTNGRGASIHTSPRPQPMRGLEFGGRCYISHLPFLHLANGVTSSETEMGGGEST